MLKLNNFAIIFLSIVLEGIPFIIIGSFISSLIHIFVSEEQIARIIPKNKFLGIFTAAIVGIIFPVCECAIVPITRKLVKKGLPINMAITFMLAVPIVNPIVIFSTYCAFIGKTYVVFMRVGFGIVGAMLIGYIMGLMEEKNPLKHQYLGSGDFAQKECSVDQVLIHRGQSNRRSVISEVLKHTSREFYDVGKLFIIGALLSTSMQVFIPKQYILSIGTGNVSSIVVMMTLAFVLSICSETDAFIARTFLGQFTLGSLIGFMILGPMIDIKNTIMLSGSFKFKFVIKLVFVIISICFLLAVVSNLIPVAELGGV